MPSAANPSRQLDVIRTDEKGSDVNLATHLVYAAMKGDFEAAVIISNDSDLSEAVRIVTQEIKKTVGILCPTKIPSADLLRYATFYKRIRKGILASCQFPATMMDDHGTFTKPASW